ncbi:MAG: phosphatidate cytidylyltransferase [Alphaproteobacteria bacterium]
MSRPLLLRILSAAALVPVAIVSAWAGGLWFAAVVGFFGVVMAWEWARLCARTDILDAAGAVTVGTVGAAAAAFAMAEPELSLALVAIGAGIVLVLRPEGRSAWLWPTGTAYIALAVLAVLHLRGGDEETPWPVFWLFAVVWATDTAAYAAGRAIGGPLLAPALSPKKTWAGLLGGMAAAGIAGALLLWAFGAPAPLTGSVLGAALALISQGGDLAESAAKRYFGVKDAGGLIPGHGGALDRLDGFMAAALALVALNMVIGEDVLGWQ